MSEGQREKKRKKLCERAFQCIYEDVASQIDAIRKKSRDYHFQISVLDVPT